MRKVCFWATEKYILRADLKRLTTVDYPAVPWYTIDEYGILSDFARVTNLKRASLF